MAYQIRLDSVRASQPDSEGARLVTIGERQLIVFDGDKSGAAAWLRAYPIGTSVEAREIVDGKSIWIRSCMNKPALWADIEARP
jgi:hypothetical protein